MWTLLAIAVFGTLGCWCRFYFTGRIQRSLGGEFPYATMSINVVGSLLMGFLAVLLLERVHLPRPITVGILTGFLGGFTTFSTFAMESLLLAEENARWKSALYVGLSITLGIGAALVGGVLAHFI